jgi:hypothetical protein
LLARDSLDGADLLHGEVVSPAYDAVHRRAILFVAGDYWLVLDRLHGELPHDYALRWHLAYDDAPTVERMSGGLTRVSAPTVLLDLTGTPEAELSVAVEPGWVSTEYGIKTPAPVVVASPKRAHGVTLLTLLTPRRAGRSPRLRSAALETGVVVVERAEGTTDRIEWHPDRPDAPHLALAPRAEAGTP